MQGATKYLKADVLVTAATRGGLDAGFLTRRICQVRVLNISEPVELMFRFAARRLRPWSSSVRRMAKAANA